MKVAVIGAGASGLTATKACLEEGFNPVCFESSSSLGGLWQYRDNPPNTESSVSDNGVEHKRGSVFKSTTTIFSKELFCFSDFPVPDEFPVYLHNTDVHKYLMLYAEKFGILKHIQFGVLVEYVGRVSSSDEDPERCGKEWTIKLRDINTSRRWVETFDAVMICTGHHSQKLIPQFEGMSNFKGRLLHTQDYRTPAGFEGKRIVVVGAGNSGADVAAELSGIADKVYLSSRRGTWLISRYQNGGLPTDLLFSKRILQLVPTAVQNAFLRHYLSRSFDYGNNLPKHRVLSAYPTINDELASRIQDGLVKVKPNVLNFTEHGISFTDGSVIENIDCVIFATGYTIGVPFLDQSVFHDQVPLYKKVFPVNGINSSSPTLAFIGLVQPWGAINSVAEIQSRWGVRIFSGSSHLPVKEHMLMDIERTNKVCRERFVDSERHALNVDATDYMDDVANQFGAKPSMLGLILQLDPLLALMYMFGPCLSHQYRMHGPGRWEGARRGIKESWLRMAQRGWVMSVEQLTVILVMAVAGVCLLVLVNYIW